MRILRSALAFLPFLPIFLQPRPMLAQTSPDPERGYSYLVNGDYIGCGIPVDLMKRAIAPTNLIPEPLLKAFFPLDAKNLFEAKPIAGRNEQNQKVDPSFNVFQTKRGNSVMNFNCLSCHGEYMDGEFVVGLGNRTRDYTSELWSFTRFLPLFAKTEGEREEVKVLNRALKAISPYIEAKTVGVNPAVNLTYALFAQRNSHDYSWSETPTLAPPPKDFPPVDVPPWWRLSHKESMFYNAEFKENHHRIMTLASVLCIDGVDELLAIEKPFLDVEAYIKKMEAPKYPRPVDPFLASQGQPLFDTHCSGCHGTYGDKGSYAEQVVPIHVIGTDPELMEQQIGPEYARFREWGEAAFFAATGESYGVEAQRGYVAPPLHGIWATAPFLHNGSVPSLETLLNSAARPRIWEKQGWNDRTDYDLRSIAVRYKELTPFQDLTHVLNRRAIYDTREKGYGNQGHTFGDVLTADERRAVIEYLKTL